MTTWNIQAVTKRPGNIARCDSRAQDKAKVKSNDFVFRPPFCRNYLVNNLNFFQCGMFLINIFMFLNVPFGDDVIGP